MLSSLKVELTFDCAACKRPGTVSALDAPCLCAACGKTTDGLSLFAGALAHDELPLDALLGGKRAAVIELAHGTTTGRLRWWSERPMCPDCGVSLDPEKMLEAARAAATDYRCPRCLASLRMRRPPPALEAVAPSLALLVDEKTLPFRPAGLPVPAPHAECRGCGAPLALGPDKRVFTCASCQKSNRISDESWVAMQPGNEGLRFHLMYEEDPVYLRALGDEGLDHARRRLLFGRAPLPEGPLAALLPKLVEQSFRGGPALELAVELAANRHVPPALVQRVRPTSADDAWRLLERDDLPLVMVLDLLRDPIGAPGNAGLAPKVKEALEGSREWRALVAKAADPRLTPAEAQLLLTQPYAAELVPTVLRNPALPEALLAERAKGSVADQLALAENPSMTPALLQQLAQGPSDEVRAKAQAHPNFPKSLWKRLFG